MSGVREVQRDLLQPAAANDGLDFGDAGVDGEQLALHLSGASSATASGSLRGLELHLSGASWVQAPDLRSRLVAASLSGVSYGLVRASGRLDASLSGASTLEYFGDPVVVSSVSGGSVVRRVGP